MAHCILNQNSRASGLAVRPSATTEIVEVLMRSGIGIVQIPCPELSYSGVSRQRQTKQQYDTQAFRESSRKIAEEMTNQVMQYAKGGVKLELIVGVDGSPSCGVDGEAGILVEELLGSLGAKGISAHFFGVDFHHVKHSANAMRRLIKPINKSEAVRGGS